MKAILFWSFRAIVKTRSSNVGYVIRYLSSTFNSFCKDFVALLVFSLYSFLCMHCELFTRCFSSPQVQSDWEQPWITTVSDRSWPWSCRRSTKADFSFILPPAFPQLSATRKHCNKSWPAIAKLKPLSIFISLLLMHEKAFDNVKIEKWKVKVVLA